VVAITGHDAPGTEARAQLSGFKGCLRKPVTAKVLMEAIEQAIGRAG
jgi:CheY-like chemotaxis protein